MRVDDGHLSKRDEGGPDGVESGHGQVDLGMKGTAVSQHCNFVRLIKHRRVWSAVI